MMRFVGGFKSWNLVSQGHKFAHVPDKPRQNSSRQDIEHKQIKCYLGKKYKFMIV